MNELDLNNLGLVEISNTEAQEIEGGWLWIPIAAGMFLLAQAAYKQKKYLHEFYMQIFFIIMIYSFLKFRAKQLSRMSRDLGIFRISTLFILLVFGLVYLYKINKEYATLVIFSLVITTIHNRRKDKEFLKYIYNKHYFSIIYIEIVTI